MTSEPDMSISLDAVASRHLWHMQDIGRLWEQHSRQCGSPVLVSILVDVPVAAPEEDRSIVHVFPTARVSDESFLGRALESYASSGRREGDFGGPSLGAHPPLSLPPAIAAPPPIAPPERASGTPTPDTGLNAPPAVSPAPPPGLPVASRGTGIDEFGLRRFQAAWRLDRPIVYKDVDHLCPPIPFLDDDYIPSGSEKQIVRIEGTVIDDFLEAVGLPTQSSVTWEVVNGLLSCARLFIDKRSYQKPWMFVGPAELNEVQYVCHYAGEDQSSLSVSSMATKAGGVSGKERSLTVAVLCALSPFWRMVVVAFCMFRPGRRQVRRVRKTAGASGRGKKGANGGGEPPAKKARNGSQSDASGVTPKDDSPPGPTQFRAMDLAAWQEAPGLDVEDRVITEAHLRGACGWFWRNRPQPGPQCLPLLSYKTLGDLGRLRPDQEASREVARTFGRLENVPGDNDCFYHVIAIGLMDRLRAFPAMNKSPFWADVGVHPGLLRWGVAAFQKAMLANGPLSQLFPTWLSLTCPGQTFSHPQLAEAVLQKAITECEGERSWMGSSHGEYAVLADILGVIIRVFSPIGCSPDGTMGKAPASQDPGQFSVAGASVDVVGQPGSRRCLIRPGSDVVQLKPSCLHVPLRYVMQAQVEAQASGESRDATVVSMRAKEIALSSSCMVLGVIHDGSAHFMYPCVYPRLLRDYTGVALPAFNVNSGSVSV